MGFYEIKKGKKEGMRRRISQTHRLMELGRTLKVIDPKGHVPQMRQLGQEKGNYQPKFHGWQRVEPKSESRTPSPN